MTEREEQIQRLTVAAWGVGDVTDIARRLYDAGARIPAPPAPPAVVVSEEAKVRFRAALKEREADNTTTLIEDSFIAMAAAFPLLLAANPLAVEAEIRQRVEALLVIAVNDTQEAGNGPKHIVIIGDVCVYRSALLAALGVAP